MKLSSVSLPAILLTASGMLLTGCATSFNPISSGPAPAAIQGAVHGGRQPIAGARLYMLTPGTSGYGGPGIAASTSNKSTSLLTAGDGSDTIGTYVLTRSDGSFSISSDYATCPANAPVYLYSVGGNTGSNTDNSAAGLMAIIGNCGTFGVGTTVNINEVSTIAAAYAMAGFASDATHVSSSGSALALTNIRTAFAHAALLFDTTSNPYNAPNTGARATTAAGNGTVPQQQLNTLANILAACVNTAGPGSSQCNTLFTGVLSNGATGSQAFDTATSAIYMAHNPAITSVYSIAGSGPQPYTPWFDGSSGNPAPNDFIVAITYTGGGIDTPITVAIDAQGNAWIANPGDFESPANAIAELDGTTGAVLSGASGYTGGGLQFPYGLAIDPSGNVWAANVGNLTVSPPTSVLSEFYGSNPPNGHTTGTPVSSTGYPGFSPMDSIAFDQAGNAWTATIEEQPYPAYLYYVSGSNGTILTQTSLSSSYPVQVYGLAVDTNTNVWFADGVNNVLEGAYGATHSSGQSTGQIYASNSITTGQSGAIGLGIDGNGYIWFPDITTVTLDQFNDNNASAAPAAFKNSYPITGDTLPAGLAIDGANRIWVADDDNPKAIAQEYCGADGFGGCTPGAQLSGSVGYSDGGLDGAHYVAVDGAGDVWFPNYGAEDGTTVTEFIGAATPIVTPVVANLLTPYGTSTVNRP